MRYKEARKIKKLEFLAIPDDAEIGKCRLLSQTSRQKIMTTDRPYRSKVEINSESTVS